mmetsp:Transcript_15728/g.24170  ORF Transcript_15728/g.24170 Transcript_15728/m.24170 type:complete len:90 (-) Transcript_15728:3882-4151(-)
MEMQFEAEHLLPKKIKSKQNSPVDLKHPGVLSPKVKKKIIKRQAYVENYEQHQGTPKAGVPPKTGSPPKATSPSGEGAPFHNQRDLMLY